MKVNKFAIFGSVKITVMSLKLTLEEDKRDTERKCFTLWLEKDS